MRKYFTNIQFCPNCFDVVDNSHLKHLDINENILKCDSCGCYFRNKILINDSKGNFLFPQFSEIKLNKIEKSYVNWVLNDFDGKYIITWPWKSVKFIPILLSQFLFKNPGSKIVIFTNPIYFQNDEFSDSSLPNILNSLYSINNPKDNNNVPIIDVDDVFIKSNLNNANLNKNFVDSIDLCFNNKFDLIPCFFDVDYCFIHSIDDINKDMVDNQLFFINESILSSHIIDLIDVISPELIIATDIDALYGKNRFGKGNKIYDLFKMDSDLLLFSVDLNQRNTHNIGQENYFLKNWNIVPHTWDYSIVLNKIKDLSMDEHSFCSSCFSDIQKIIPIFDIEFIECEVLLDIESTFEIFYEIFPHDKKIMDSLKDLMKTPLYIKGAHNDYRVLNRNVTFEYLFNLIYNIDLDKWESLMGIFDEVYDFHGTGKNPIAESLVELIKNKNISQDELVVIVHKYDIKGTERILEDYLGENDILVSSWSDLDDDIKDTTITYAISTIFPQPKYNAFSSQIEKLDIICSPNNHKRFEVYKKNRFTANGLKPVYLLSEDEKAPYLLEYCLRDVEVPQEYYDELNKIHELDFIYNSYSLMFKRFNYSKLRKNDNAILILNSYGQSMFLKFNTIIYILDEGGKPVDFEIEYKNYGDLVNNKIMINEGGYHSIGHIFFKFVIENGQDIILHEGKFKWHGFKNLVENMFEWVEILNNIAHDEFKRSSKDLDSIKLDLAKELSGLGLTAEREKYIMDVWLDEPQPLETTEGVINIYEAERPHGKDDIPKIYKWVSSTYSQFALTNLGASKCFTASKLLKRIRKNFLKTESSKLGKDLDDLNLEFKQFLNEEKELFNKFQIDSVEKVKIKHDAPSFEIINNPEDYIK
ncbi:hypothetical protein TL18_04610 [Methanobrevibacter sp. YE315]|uniref:hypothetical protein n=1 Tax=Methanobrevibacter sp. YE315 TaxID=1609968 RepID=UPI000764E092|nr:hypothetical protein [Methanobrevibacter sp. YE315]AMD17363.1 hypothetical protein TL18_04610 [Methanobrevibacter sp. YE315]